MPLPPDAEHAGGGLPLELDGAAFRALCAKAVERIAAHVDSLALQPAADLEGAAEAADAVPRDFDEAGAPAEGLLDELFQRWIPKSLNTAGPGYLAYIPGGGILSAAVADLVACATNRYVGAAFAAPALARLEAVVVRWCARLVGLPEGAGGVLSSGGSLANFSAVVAARHHLLGEETRRGVVYVSDQAHHSLAKAAFLAGGPRANLRVLPSDGRFRMRAEAVAPAIAQDRARGLVPFLLCANAGTTNCGAIDPLEALAEIARAEGLWLHVDAAYGGTFALTERGRLALRGMGAADSVTLDPHKGLFLPYGTGCLLVRHPERLRAAHAQGADYLPVLGAEDESPCELSPELSRDFRGLRVWLPLRLHGVAAFRAALDEKLDLARLAAERLAESDHLEVLAPPELSLFAFRLRAPGLAPEEIDRGTQAVLERVNARRRVHITGTRLGGRYAGRICVLSFRTHRDRLLECCEALIEESARLLG
jgi:aromatic-L-amino-acid decarboxylase